MRLNPLQVSVALVVPLQLFTHHARHLRQLGLFPRTLRCSERLVAHLYLLRRQVAGSSYPETDFDEGVQDLPLGQYQTSPAACTLISTRTRTRIQMSQRRSLPSNLTSLTSTKPVPWHVSAHVPALGSSDVTHICTGA